MIIYDFYNIRNGENVGYASVESIETINYDYLSKNNFELPINFLYQNLNLKSIEGTFVEIRAENQKSNTRMGVGFVQKVEEGKINIESIIDYLDFSFNVQDYSFKGIIIENMINDIISNKYLTNVDTLQNLNVKINIKTNTTGNLYMESNLFTYSLKEIIVDVFNKFNIVVNVTLNNGKVIIEIGKKEADYLEIDFKSKEAIDFAFSDISLKENKINLYRKTTTDNKDSYVFINSYYLLVDNTITTNPDDLGRILPIIETTENIGEDDDIDDFISKKLVNSEYNNELTFKILKNSKIYPENELFIGRKVKLFNGDLNVINSVITEITNTNTDIYYTIKCGTNRLGLIEVLKEKNIF